MRRGQAALATLLLVGGTLGCRSFETRASFSVELQPGGMLRVAHGRRTARIDLRQDIVGCLGEQFDPATGDRLGPGEGKSKVLDVTADGGDYFVLAMAVAVPNCNLQGACGAGDPDVTLVWLRVGPDLYVQSKQVFAVADCRAPRWVEGVAYGWQDQLRLTNGLVSLKFTELVFPPGVDEVVEVAGQVQYDKAAARAGITITRIKRP